MKTESTTAKRGLAQTIIELHANGYTEDFFIDSLGQLIWSQNGKAFHEIEVVADLYEMKLIRASKIVRFVYLIVSQCGLKGILVNDISYQPNSNAQKILETGLYYSDMEGLKRSSVKNTRLRRAC